MAEALAMLRKLYPYLLAALLLLMMLVSFRLYAQAATSAAAVEQAEKTVSQVRSEARSSRAEARELRRQLVKASVEVGETRARLAAVRDDLKATEEAKDRAESLSTANIFIRQFVTVLNDENSRRLSALNSLEAAVSRDAGFDPGARRKMDTFIADERREAMTHMDLVKATVDRHYPGVSDVFTLHDEPHEEDEE